MPEPAGSQVKQDLEQLGLDAGHGRTREVALTLAGSQSKQTRRKEGAFNPVLQRQQDESSCLRSFHKSGAELGSGLTRYPSSPQP